MQAYLGGASRCSPCAEVETRPAGPGGKCGGVFKKVGGLFFERMKDMLKKKQAEEAAAALALEQEPGALEDDPAGRGPALEGEKVRICTDLCRRVSCGAEGTVLRVVGQRVHVQTDNLQIHDVPVDVVQPVKKLVPRHKLKSLGFTNAVLRSLWLQQCGWNAHFLKADSLQTSAIELEGNAPYMVSVEQMRLRWKYLEFALNLKAFEASTVKFVDPELMYCWYAGITETTGCHEPRAAAQGHRGGVLHWRPGARAPRLGAALDAPGPRP